MKNEDFFRSAVQQLNRISLPDGSMNKPPYLAHPFLSNQTSIFVPMSGADVTCALLPDVKTIYLCDTQPFLTNLQLWLSLKDRKGIFHPEIAQQLLFFSASYFAVMPEGYDFNTPYDLFAQLYLFEERVEEPTFLFQYNAVVCGKLYTES